MGEPKLERRDLDLYISFGFICHGPFADYAAVREFIRKLPRTRLIYHTGSTRQLMIVREGYERKRENGEEKRGAQEKFL